MKVFVVGGALGYANFLEGITLVNEVEEADVVLFTGGEDVTPSLYNCKKHSTTYCNPSRDLAEKEVFNKIKENQIALGICRGSQFLCVMNGGLLVQNVHDHAMGRTHGIKSGKDDLDVIYQITSTHHQMQYPYNMNSDDYDVLYTSDTRRSDCYEGDGIDIDTILDLGEPEIVLYHKKGFPKCLAVQGHPEMIPESPVAKMIFKLVKDLVDENKCIYSRRGSRALYHK